MSSSISQADFDRFKQSSDSYGALLGRWLDAGGRVLEGNPATVSEFIAAQTKMRDAGDAMFAELDRLRPKLDPTIRERVYGLQRLLYIPGCPVELDMPSFSPAMVQLEETLQDCVSRADADPLKDKPRRRMKREVAEPLIADYLQRRPHDTAEEVATTVGCSVGVVAESPVWELNQCRLKTAKSQGVDPKAIKLTEEAVNAAGGSKMTQLHDARQRSQRTDAEIDEQQKELYRRIGDFENDHPGATPEQVASALGCTAGEVERRQATLERLEAEQAESEREDKDEEDPIAKRGTRRKWVDKKV